MTKLRFDGRVAIVTGAGRGLGREYALELARRGCRVVVNDLGAELDGAGRSSEAADSVVREIVASGGQARADAGSVIDGSDVAAMVARTLAEWDRIDILVTNAGVLRDRALTEMTIEDIAAAIDIHLVGQVRCVKAVWDAMVRQNYGRIVVTSSSSALYGKAERSGYAAGKLGIVGFMQALKLEGRPHGIRINAVSPVAGTRMTEGLAMAEERFAALHPRNVAPGVVYLSSDEAPSGVILSAGGGAYAVSSIYDALPIQLRSEANSAEGVRDHWQALENDHLQTFTTGAEQSRRMFDGLL